MIKSNPSEAARRSLRAGDGSLDRVCPHRLPVRRHNLCGQLSIIHNQAKLHQVGGIQILRAKIERMLIGDHELGVVADLAAIRPSAFLREPQTSDVEALAD